MASGRVLTSVGQSFEIGTNPVVIRANLRIHKHGYQRPSILIVFEKSNNPP
jgi:hypothetical protein